MNFSDYTINIPFTVWDKKSGSPADTATAKFHKGFFSLVFYEPINPFGADKTAMINKAFSAAGFSGIVDKAVWDDNYIYLYFHINQIPPEGGTITAIPIAVIVGGVLAIAGIGLAIALLSKVQKILELPVIPIVLIAVILLLVIKLIKEFKKR